MKRLWFRPSARQTAIPSAVPSSVAPAPPSGDSASEELPEMSFIDHLEDLRWSIIKGLAALIVATIIISFYSQWILDRVLLGPTHKDFFMYRVLSVDAVDVVLQSRNPTGQFFAYFGTILAVGLVVGSPLVVYFLWKFIEPGLYSHEKKGMRFAAFFATMFFILGLSFGFLIITPLALQFFANFQISETVVNEFDISRYFNLVVSWTFGVGILFELPVVMYFLAKIGIINSVMLKGSRRYAIVGALVLGALFTPPDPISQILVATPLMLLYELSIVIVAYVDRQKRKREALEQKATPVAPVAAPIETNP